MYEGRQEGKETVHGHADKQTLPPAHFISHATPEESPHHHPHVYNATYRVGKGAGKKFSDRKIHKYRRSKALEKWHSITQKITWVGFILFVLHCVVVSITKPNKINGNNLTSIPLTLKGYRCGLYQVYHKL